VYCVLIWGYLSCLFIDEMQVKQWLNHGQSSGQICPNSRQISLKSYQSKAAKNLTKKIKIVKKFIFWPIVENAI
jgi:hypothetical protein